MDEPKYVVGFLFNNDLSKVVLIQKTKPAWQNGLLNGVGGKVEPGEYAKDAMAREFMEETGVVADLDWVRFALFHLGARDPDPLAQHGRIACFTSKADDAIFYSVSTTTEEQVFIVDTKNIQGAKTVPNLKWLIPFAIDSHRDGGVKFAEVIF